MQVLCKAVAMSTDLPGCSMLSFSLVVLMSRSRPSTSGLAGHACEPVAGDHSVLATPQTCGTALALHLVPPRSGCVYCSSE